MSLSQLERAAMTRSQVPKIYRQRLPRQPMPQRMAGNLKPLGYDVLVDVRLDHPAVTYEALTPFQRRHGVEFVQHFAERSVREPSVAALLSQEMLAHQRVLVEAELEG